MAPRLGILLRDVHWQRPTYTSIHLARAALEAGWSVELLSVGDLMVGGRGGTRLQAQVCHLEETLTAAEICRGLFEGTWPPVMLDLRALSLLLLRFNPSARDPFAIDWNLWWPALELAGRVQAAGVPVVNSPQGLQTLITKNYLLDLPEEISIPSLITRSPAAIVAFQEEQGGRPLIAKPLAGSGGDRVFLLQTEDRANRDQILETLLQHGYALVQPFLEAGREGDLRVLLVDGEPIELEGQLAVYRRRGPAGRVRNNMHAGGHRETAELGEQERRTLECLRPSLLAHDIRFAGVDLLAGRVLEVNAFCPGGIENINSVLGVDVAPRIFSRLVAARKGVNP